MKFTEVFFKSYIYASQSASLDGIIIWTTSTAAFTIMDNRLGMLGMLRMFVTFYSLASDIQCMLCQPSSSQPFMASKYVYWLLGYSPTNLSF